MSPFSVRAGDSCPSQCILKIWDRNHRKYSDNRHDNKELDEREGSWIAHLPFSVPRARLLCYAL